MSIYSSKIVKLGEQSELFLAEGIVVFFGDNAPEELQDVAVVHELKPVNGDIAVGTTIELSGEVLKVTSIGEVANENFKKSRSFGIKTRFCRRSSFARRCQLLIFKDSRYSCW